MCSPLVWIPICPQHPFHRLAGLNNRQIKEAYDLLEQQRSSHHPGMRIWQRGTVVSRLAVARRGGREYVVTLFFQRTRLCACLVGPGRERNIGGGRAETNIVL